MKFLLIKKRFDINIKTSSDKKKKKKVAFFDSQIPIPLPLSVSSPALHSPMQIIPAECRYLGLFVMVEVYHSLRRRCAAWHELMMNAGRDRRRERERADSCREATQGRTGGRKNVSGRLVRH